MNTMMIHCMLMQQQQGKEEVAMPETGDHHSFPVPVLFEGKRNRGSDF
jgi:hypothetical protein